MLTFVHLRDELQKEYEIVQSWTRIAERFSPPITRAHIYRIVKDGWEPERNDIREALGLLPLHLVEGCPICHQTHTHAHGEQTYNPAAQVVKPKPKPRKPRARIAISKDNMTSAAHTIVDNISPGYVNQLIVKLLTLTHK